MLTFTVGAAAVTYGLIRATAHGWTAGLTLGLLALGVIALAGFAWVEHRSTAPLLDLALLGRPAFSGVLAAALLLNAAAFACLPYSSLWLQSVLGLSPVRAGLEGAAPLSLAAFVISALIGRFLHGPSPRWIIGGGLLLIGAGALVQARAGADAGGLVLLPGLIVAGAGVGLATPTLVSTAMSAVPQHSGGMAAGAVNTARQLGFTFGVAVLGSAFAARTQSVLTARGAPVSVGRAVAGGQARAVLADQPAAQRGHLSALIHVATAAGLNSALLIAGLLGLLGAAVAVATMRRPAAQLSPGERQAGRGRQRDAR